MLSKADFPKRISLCHTSFGAFRIGVSECNAALIALYVLHDAGIARAEEKNVFFDKNKVKNEKFKFWKKILTEGDVEGIKTKCIFFDRRKGKTFFIRKQGGKLHRREKDKEHITMLSEPVLEHLCHLTRLSGHWEEISIPLYPFLCQNVLYFSELIAVGCDS